MKETSKGNVKTYERSWRSANSRYDPTQLEELYKQRKSIEKRYTKPKKTTNNKSINKKHKNPKYCEQSNKVWSTRYNNNILYSFNIDSTSSIFQRVER